MIHDHHEDRVLDQTDDHKEQTIKIATNEEEAAPCIATAGWNAQIYLTSSKSSMGMTCVKEDLLLPLPLRSTQKQNHALDIQFADVLSSWSYVETPPSRQLSAVDTIGTSLILRSLGSFNLALDSNVWSSLSQFSIALCPCDPMLLAIAPFAAPYE